MKKCEGCDKEHDGSYASGRFCTKECAKGFSHKHFNLSDEAKDKISVSLKKRWKQNDFHTVNWHLAGAKGSKGKYKDPENIMEVSSRTIRKIMKRLIDNENMGCSNCGWKEGIGDVHHIRGKKIENPDNHKNLSYLCPNCHRLAHEKQIKEDQLISFFDQIGDNWKKYYYG